MAVTMEGVIRLIASRTAWNADMWRKFIFEGPGRALPELEGDGLNVFDGQNITTVLNFQRQVRSRLQAGELPQLVAESEAPINPVRPPDPMARGGLTNGDLKWMYKAIASNSQRNVFLGKVADATADGKAIDSAISSNFGVYGNWLWHFSRWGQTWGKICESFLGLVGLLKKIEEGSLESKDIWKYKDTEAFQASFDDLENQQYLHDLRVWDPQEFALLHPQDLAGNRPPGDPLFWSEPLARYMTEEVFGGAIVVDKSNFLRHKDLAERVRAEQKAIRRALHIVESYVDETQEISFLPDLKPSSILGALTGLALGVFGATLVGFPMGQGRSYRPAVVLALVGWWVTSQLRHRLGLLESLTISLTALVGGLWTIWVIGSTKATYLRKGLPAAQATLRIMSLLPRGWGLIFLVVFVLLFILRRAKN